MRKKLVAVLLVMLLTVPLFLPRMIVQAMMYYPDYDNIFLDVELSEDESNVEKIQMSYCYYDKGEMNNFYSYNIAFMEMPPKDDSDYCINGSLNWNDLVNNMNKGDGEVVMDPSLESSVGYVEYNPVLIPSESGENGTCIEGTLVFDNKEVLEKLKTDKSYTAVLLCSKSSSEDGSQDGETFYTGINLPFSMGDYIDLSEEIDEETEPRNFLTSTNPNLSLGEFDLTTKTFKDATGSGDDKFGCVAIYMSSVMTAGDTIVLPEGYEKSSLSDTYKIYIPLNEKKTVSEIADDLISKVKFNISVKQNVRFELMEEVPTTPYFYFDKTGHYYTYVDDEDANWIEAYEDAKNMTYNGRQGYLATVTSLEEDMFVYRASGNKVGWLGGTRLSLEGKDGQYYISIGKTTDVDYWRWACGPEIGVEFFDTIKVPDSRSTDPNDTALRAEIFRRNAEDNKYYFNWDVGEPSNGNEKENCLTTLIMGNGYSTDIQGYSWNDVPYNKVGISSYDPLGYLVEFGDLETGDSHSLNNPFADGKIIIPVANIDDKPYATIEDAVNDVDDGEVIKLVKDTESEEITVSKEIEFSIDSNGYDNNVTIKADDGYKIKTDKKGNIIKYTVTSTKSKLSLGEFDLTTKTFKDATGSGDNKFGCVAIYMSSVMATGDNIVLPEGYEKSLNSDAYKIYIPLNDKKTASEIATDLISKIKFNISAKQSIRVELMEDVPTTPYFYFDKTGHYYTFVEDAKANWINAYEGAKKMTYNGRQGYLATVTSLEEDMFVYVASGNKVGWLGGTRLSLEDKNGQYYTTIGQNMDVDYWRWACGPEMDNVFYPIKITKSKDDYDKYIKDYYFNWEIDENLEPNTSIENCLTTLNVGQGYSVDIAGYSWNDISWSRHSSDPLDKYNPKGYLVEFGDLETGDSHSLNNPFADGKIIIPVATIDDKPYATIEDAVKDVKNGETIKLVKDTESEEITVSKEIEFSIDSNGYDNNVTIKADDGYKIKTDKKGNIIKYTVTSTKSNLSLGEFDLNTKTFKDATGSGDDKFGCVAIYMSSVMTAGDNIVLPEGYGKSSLSDDYKIYIPLNEKKTVSEIADNLISKVKFNISVKQNVRFELMEEVPTTPYFYFDKTGHYYTFVEDAKANWINAYEGAKKMTYNGRQGYLATVTSLEEDEFIYRASKNHVGWLGGTRLSLEGKDGQCYISIGKTTDVDYWRWACGPERDNIFYPIIKTESIDDYDKYKENYYFNWEMNDYLEPNNGSGDGENCLMIAHVGQGCSVDVADYSWNDIPYNGHQTDKYNPKGYLVEFGDLETGDSHSLNNPFADGRIIIPVATIDDKPYATIEDAVKDVDDGEVIKLVKDTQVEEITVSKEIEFSIDTNGYDNNVTIKADDGYALKTKEEGNVTTYKVAEAVANIDDKPYATIEDAIEDVEEGETIKLVKDTESEEITVSKEIEFSIDTNGNDNNTIIKAGDGYVLKTETDGNITTYKVLEAVANIDDKLYATIEDAVEEVEDGETIKLVKDTESEEITVSKEIEFSIDTNGNDNNATIKAGDGYVLKTETDGNITTYKVTEDEKNNEYMIIKGANSEWKKQSTDDLLIASDAPFNKFMNVEIDGVVIDESNYISKEGSTEIYLRADYLNTLALGSHSIKIVSTDGYAQTNFTITPITQPSNNNDASDKTNNSDSGSDKDNGKEVVPSTGELNSYTSMIGFILLMISIALFITINIKKRYRAE